MNPLVPALNNINIISFLNSLPDNYGRGEDWKYSNIRGALQKLSIENSTLQCHKPLWKIKCSEALKIMQDEQGNITLSLPSGMKAYCEIGLLCNESSYIATKLHIEVGEGAELDMIESQVSEEDQSQKNDIKDNPVQNYWKNIDEFIEISPGARVNCARILENGQSSVVVHKTQVKISRNSKFIYQTLNTGEGFLRNELIVNLVETGAEAEISGLSLLGNRSHGDTTLRINHMAPHCRSSQYFKTILRDSAHGVYQGKIHVHKDAQKTDGYQLSNNIILSQLAEMNVKPELEIYADDVKCSHGSTTGELDESPLFYMKSRGIDEGTARQLLLHAFIDDIIDQINPYQWQNMFRFMAHQWVEKF